MLEISKAIDSDREIELSPDERAHFTEYVKKHLSVWQPWWLQREEINTGIQEVSNVKD